MKLQSKMKFGYDISLEKGCFKPVKVQFWKDEKKFQTTPPTAPLKYFADAMVGLSLFKMNQYLKSPIMIPHMNYDFANTAWNYLDPHQEIYKRSQERVAAFAHGKKKFPEAHITAFEKDFSEAFEKCQKPWGVDLHEMASLLDVVASFETKLKSPLLFNFEVKFSNTFTEKLHVFYSFLFNLRSLVAVDHNAHIDDSSHEAVKVDAITDYLPKAEYVVNDALLYLNFKKLSQPYSGARSDGQIDKLFVAPMSKVFQKYSHNACYLIDNLPESFLNSMSPPELEEALYLVQMDWLLGSHAGLLFKIREELFGLRDGYESVFWTDAEPVATNKAVTLSVSCELCEKQIHQHQAA